MVLLRLEDGMEEVFLLGAVVGEEVKRLRIVNFAVAVLNEPDAWTRSA